MTKVLLNPKALNPSYKNLPSFIWDKYLGHKFEKLVYFCIIHLDFFLLFLGGGCVLLEFPEIFLPKQIEFWGLHYLVKKNQIYQLTPNDVIKFKSKWVVFVL
jgi:hypothetical protein